MAVISPFGRVLSRHLSSRSSTLLTRLYPSTPVLRAQLLCYNDPCIKATSQTDTSIKLFSSTASNHATAAAKKPASRPKSHTGRTTAKKAAGGKKGGQAKATKTKAAKPRAKPKKPVVKKRKPRAKKAPSVTAIHKVEVQKRKDLKAQALLDEPKKLPASAYQVHFAESIKKGNPKSVQEAREGTKEAAASYHQLQPEERERLNHIANQNKAENDANYKQWVSQFHPLEIKEANNARKQLARAQKAKGKKGKKGVLHLIKDERLVKQPLGAFNFFSKARWASGDFRSMQLPEVAKLIGREWKALTSAEKKPYEDQHAAEINRYQEEHQTVYNTSPTNVKRSRKAATAA